jgi:hypothetical protein
MKTRVGLSALALMLSILVASCSNVSVPIVLANTPTRPPTQVPLPTRVAVAVPTPTIANLIPPGDTSEAVTMLNDFIEAVTKGDIDGALSYWDTSQPSQPSGYAANVRKMVQDWIDKKRRLVLADIAYSGLDATGKYVAMPLSDPRVEHATAKIQIDGAEYLFYLIQLKGGWIIDGVNTLK